MNAKNKVFLDTNLPVYAHTNVDVPKQQNIQHIITTENTVISTQVFRETANVLSKKFGFAWKDIQKVLQEMRQNNEVYINTLPTIRQACQIAERYGFSFYDSLVLQWSEMQRRRVFISAPADWWEGGGRLVTTGAFTGLFNGSGEGLAIG